MKGNNGVHQKINHIFSSTLSPRSLPKSRWIKILIGGNLSGVFGNRAVLTVKLRCSLFNLNLSEVADKESTLFLWGAVMMRWLTAAERTPRRNLEA